MVTRRDFAFKKVFATAFPGGGILVQWWMSNTYPAAVADPVFFIDVATATDNWQRLNTVPVANACMYVDENQRRCGSSESVYYRVAAYDGVTEHLSPPVQLLGGLLPHDYRIAREIIRKEYLRLKKYSGTAGMLYKRRTSGTRCPECTDWDIEDSPGKSQCRTCYGTGFVGGYYSGFPFWIDIANDMSNKDVNPPFGVTDLQVRTGRVVAYPVIDTYDMWAQEGTDKRYIIRKTQDATTLKTWPLVIMLELHGIPFSAIEYTVPEHQEDPEYTGLPVTSSREGWRTGISYDYDIK